MCRWFDSAPGHQEFSKTPPPGGVFVSAPGNHHGRAVSAAFPQGAPGRNRPLPHCRIRQFPTHPQTFRAHALRCCMSLRHHSVKTPIDYMQLDKYDSCLPHDNVANRNFLAPNQNSKIENVHRCDAVPHGPSMRVVSWLDRHRSNVAFSAECTIRKPAARSRPS